MYLWPNCSSDAPYGPHMIEMYIEKYVDAHEVQWSLRYPMLRIFRGRHCHIILINAHMRKQYYYSIRSCTLII